MVRKICTYLCDDAYGVFSYYSDNTLSMEIFLLVLCLPRIFNLIRPGRHGLLKSGNPGKGSIMQC